MIKLLTRQRSSFTYLNATQFLGALNDNLYKLLIAYFCIDVLGAEHSTRILATVGAIFVIPFLLFSSTSGMLADRYSKRNIIVICKALETVIMALGTVALAMHGVWGVYIILFLMASQSALFGPSKYGIIPELVKMENISKANGMITMMTFLAIIIGTFLASFVTDITDRNFIITGAVCTLVAIAGLLTSIAIEKTPAAGSTRKIHPWFILEIYRTTRAISRRPTLLVAAIGSAYFLFAGAFLQLNMIPFAIESLNLTDVQGGYLFLMAAIGIGSGSALAGKISGKTVELGLVPIGGIGMAIGCFLLDGCSDHLWLIVPLIVIVGAFGGVYLIPLDAYIQLASPKKIRGQVLATTNFFAFVGVLAASAVLFLLSEVLELEADKGFTFLGFLTIAITVLVSSQMYHYFTRYLGMLVSRLHFKISVHGDEHAPKERPSIFICHHTAWNDTLILLGAQHVPMRFFAERLHTHSKLLHRLYRLLKVITIRSINDIELSPRKCKLIRSSLRRGISICILLDEAHPMESPEQLKAAFRKTLIKTAASIVTVDIKKEEKPQGTKIERFLQKIRVPAHVTFTKIDD